MHLFMGMDLPKGMINITQSAFFFNDRRLHSVCAKSALKDSSKASTFLCVSINAM